MEYRWKGFIRNDWPVWVVHVVVLNDRTNKSSPFVVDQFYFPCVHLTSKESKRLKHHESQFSTFLHNKINNVASASSAPDSRNVPWFTETSADIWHDFREKENVLFIATWFKRFARWWFAHLLSEEIGWTRKNIISLWRWQVSLFTRGSWCSNGGENNSSPPLMSSGHPGESLYSIWQV